ncbi:hypothetical protein GGS23DRAFT_408221 [Durotheca rogersii]|uniref:uncharacterized protein n=1 Tax=Durotheca rogersii TaxID=419775 RepID=UPI0022204E26|nr:uncharacterized protein GGS23DRAFT_408221 [Durotheca rogersii]KAI5865092.1 hypothetical protein GGS23DRAFT_408221 [Durotheca rogersii]
MDVASPGNAKVGKLLPKKLAGKWKKQPSKESFGSTASSEDFPRGRSLNDHELPDDGSLPATHPFGPVGGITDGDDGARGFREAADADDPDQQNFRSNRSASVRPTVPSTHPSQIGQLTTSSPLIQADHIPEAHNRNQDDLSGLSRSATFVPTAGFSFEPHRPLVTSKTGLQPLQDPSTRRSKSPTSRIRDAFKSKKILGGVEDVECDSRADTIDPDLPNTSSRASTAGSASQPGSSTVSQTDTNDTQVASSQRPHRSSSPPLADTSARPRTPPASEPAAPVIVNTPPTPTESHHSQRSRKGSSASTSSNPNVVVSSSGNMISHRRLRSGSSASVGPSKLSNITLAPLTPTQENAPPLTPGGGFFSSMLSAAQNAANTFSSTITNTNVGPGGGKPKASTARETRPADDDRVEVEPSVAQSGGPNMGEKELAVKTLGMGDLSLSQLGIQDAGSAAPTPIASRFSEPTTEPRGRSESAPVDSVAASVNDDGHSDDLGVIHPRAAVESAATSPPTSIYEGKSGVQRTGSVRSAIGPRRKRGSTGGTAGTGTTIGAAIAAANASVAHPSATGSVPKLTGFAVASKKRNRDFHALFKSVPDDDYLIEDYSCALQREILAHGRLYVSESHLCFSSNIFGWVTTLVMSFDEIVSVEKRSTALVFKNGLMITTLHAKHIFASFASRDSTYDLIVNIWKLGHPSLQSSLNGVSLEGTGGDKTEKVEEGEAVVGSRSGTGSEDEESEDGDVYDEDQDDDDDAPEASPSAEASPADTDGEKSAARKVSGAVAANGATDKPDSAPAATGVADFPGPATHAPTDCGDAETHYDIVVGEDTIPAPLGKVYNLVFGPASVSFMGKWLTNEQKCTDLQMEDKKGLTLDNKSRGYTYIKPLTGSIGPRQTKCLVNETLDNFDLEKCVNVSVATQNPDVPSGNVFSVKTKYCLFWAENNSTRVTINCTIEWTGKSWLKGPIEKGAKDGQTQYCKDLFASLKAAVSGPRSATLAGGAGKGKKKRAKGKFHQASKESLASPTQLAAAKSQDWGPLEPLHGLLGPVIDIIKPVLTGNVVYGLLVGLLVATWFGFGFNGRPGGARYGHEMGFIGYPERAIAYEEIWRREESDLWDWLEDRVGLQRLNEETIPVRKRVMEPQTVEEKLREERMKEKEVEEAIKITEEKLQVLKSVMDRKKSPKRSSGHSRPTTNVPASKR